MKKYLHPKFLPILIPAVGLLGLLLRLWTMGSGPDTEGLYTPQPFAWALLWLVTLVALAGIVLLSARLKVSGRYADNFPASPFGAGGCAAAALVVMMSGLSLLTSATDLLATLTGILGVVSAAGLILLAFTRLRGQKPSFLPHALLCLFFALRIFDRCKAWSNVPQIGTFLFQFLSSICVMLAVYQMACFDVNLGKRRAYLFWSLSGVYFSILAIPSGEETLFYICMVLWLMTNLCSVRPMKPRKPQPAPEVNPETTPEAAQITSEPAAPAEEPSAPVSNTAFREDMSLDELAKWLDNQ